VSSERQRQDRTRRGLGILRSWWLNTMYSNFPSIAHFEQSIARRSNTHSIKLLSEPSFEIDSIQGQQVVTFCRQCSEQDRLVLCLRVEENALRGPGIVHPLDSLAKHAREVGLRVFADLRQVAKRFLAAVVRAYELPAPLFASSMIKRLAPFSEPEAESSTLVSRNNLTSS
jgi:hypothetical protein